MRHLLPARIPRRSGQSSARRSTCRRLCITAYRTDLRSTPFLSAQPLSSPRSPFLVYAALFFTAQPLSSRRSTWSRNQLLRREHNDCAHHDCAHNDCAHNDCAERRTPTTNAGATPRSRACLSLDVQMPRHARPVDGASNICTSTVVPIPVRRPHSLRRRGDCRCVVLPSVRTAQRHRARQSSTSRAT